MTQRTRLLPLAAGATFLALLDVTVVNLAIPALGRAYPHSSLSSLSWVVTAYATLFAAFLAPSGRLADTIGRRTLFRVGAGGFVLMSAACAAAPNIPLLLVARGLQGAAAAAMIPASLAIVLTDTPNERRMAAVGVWSAAGAFAAAVGPSVGGILVQLVGWRSLFLINVPLGVVLVALGRAIPRSQRRDGALPDPFGTVLVAVGVGLAALGISEGATWGWGDSRTVLALVVGAVALTVAIVRSHRSAAPAIETNLWRHRTFAFANVASFLYGMALYSWMLLGVLVLTELWHYSELQAGLAMTPGAIFASAAAIIGSRARSHSGPRTLTVAGALTMAGVGAVLAATLPMRPDFIGYWLPVGVVLGIGMGLVTTGTSTAAALSLPRTAFAAGTGLNLTARQVGGAFGIATLATLIHTGVSHGTFEHVYGFCAIASAGAALAGSQLTLRSVASEPEKEAADPYLQGSGELAVRGFERFVLVGDSMAAGIGDPTPGYKHLGWGTRVAAALGADVAYLNLGKRGLLAREVRETQLQAALEFHPDLAAVMCGGNDLMRADCDDAAVEQEIDEIVLALRRGGSEVIMFRLFDISTSELVPEEYKPNMRQLIDRFGAISAAVAARHGALLLDFGAHPAGAEASMYSADLMHLSARGHAIFAANTLEALRRRSNEQTLATA